jgi:hypothetical protein
MDYLTDSLNTRACPIALEDLTPGLLEGEA